MIPKSFIEFLIYTLVTILALVILSLVIISPPNFTDNKSVYQGF